jgi:hypothetical protein
MRNGLIALLLTGLLAAGGCGKDTIYESKLRTAVDNAQTAERKTHGERFAYEHYEYKINVDGKEVCVSLPKSNVGSPNFNYSVDGIRIKVETDDETYRVYFNEEVVDTPVETHEFTGRVLDSVLREQERLRTQGQKVAQEALSE